MYEFIKIEGYSCWFLRFGQDDTIETHGEFQQSMKDRNFRKIFHDAHMQKNPDDWCKRIMHKAIVHGLDYATIVKKYDNGIAINSAGGYFPITEKDIITESIYSKSYPITEKIGEIIICENDENTHKYWLEYLSRRFPNKNISVLNYFDTRNDEEIQAYFKDAEYITFSTTFIKTDWFETLLRLRQNKNKVIAHCNDKDRLEEVMNEYDFKNIELIEL